MAQSKPRPFPFLPIALREALELSLAIVDASKKSKHKKAAFRHLANEASKFVEDMLNCYQIIEQYFPHGIPEDLAVVLQRSVNLLKSLLNFMGRVASRNSFTALFFYLSDAKRVKMLGLSLGMNRESFKIMFNAHIMRLGPKLSAETVEALKQRFEAGTDVETELE